MQPRAAKAEPFSRCRSATISARSPVAQRAPMPSTAVRPGRPISEGAIDQIKERALQGDARAQNDWGVLHQLGKAVPQDDVEAVRWYRRAAELAVVIVVPVFKRLGLGFSFPQQRRTAADFAINLLRRIRPTCRYQGRQRQTKQTR